MVEEAVWVEEKYVRSRLSPDELGRGFCLYLFPAFGLC
jgi:hypothetical protein